MIWIATLCLLAVTGWLVLNALNERQWVEDHSHDETVAADPGFLPDMGKVSKRVSDVKQQLSLEDDDTKLSRAVSKVQTSTGRAPSSRSSAVTPCLPKSRTKCQARSPQAWTKSTEQ